MTGRVQPTTSDLLVTDRLTEGQRRFLELFRHTRFKRAFYLTGGAGLSAGYLAHRHSDDLDFFTPEPFKIKSIIQFMKQIEGLKDLQWLLPRDRTTFMLTFEDDEQVKVEYRHFPFHPILPPTSIGDFYVDSMVDLLANKLYALIERRYELDRIDIYLMLRELPNRRLLEAIASCEEKFGFDLSIRGSVTKRLLGDVPTQCPEALFSPLDMTAMASYLQERVDAE
jgi:predicted nucleotidyltransferase component of viral defense system